MLVTDSSTPSVQVPRIKVFEADIAPTRSALLSHPIFSQIKNVEQMRLFMQFHVFAVWDFMSLLKTLQVGLTCVRVPWTPPTNASAARFVNEIIVAEECDEIAPGTYLSHFELYTAAMKDCGAETAMIDLFVREVAMDGDVEKAMKRSGAPSFVSDFVTSTMEFCQLRPHEVAAAFLFGREDIIPEMFTRVLKDTEIPGQETFRKLKLYLDRHIEIDGGSHGPMAKQLMISLCSDDPTKWQQAAVIAEKALSARFALWEGIANFIRETSTAARPIDFIEAREACDA